MKFKKWLESVATIGSPPTRTGDHEEFDGGGDEGWDWESLRARFGNQLGRWFPTSPTARQLKRITDSYIFNEAQNDQPTEVNTYTVMMTPTGGYTQIVLTWKMEMTDPRIDQMIQDIKQQLLVSPDLWRSLGIPGQEAYATLDKGQFLLFMVHHTLSFLYRFIQENKEGAARCFRYIRDNPAVAQQMVSEFAAKYQAKTGIKPQIRWQPSEQPSAMNFFQPSKYVQVQAHQYYRIVVENAVR
jgi:hypothetical protein